MLRDTAIDDVIHMLGNRKELRARILQEMEHVMQFKLSIGTFTPWFTIAELSGTNTITMQERVKLPVDFLSELEEAYLEVLDPETGKFIPLDKLDYDTMDSLYEFVEPGLPKAYTILGEYFRLRPLPDAAYSLQMVYQAKPASIMDANIENFWLREAPDLVIARTAESMCKYTRDFKLQKALEGDIKTAWERLFIISERREHMNRSYKMGARDDS